MKTKAFLLGIMLLGASTSSFAQEECCKTEREAGWCWGDDPGKAKEQNVLYTDFVNASNFSGAEAPLDWLQQNVPCLHVSLYQNGAKVYSGLAKEAKAAKDEAKEDAYQDKALQQFDLRIKYFGQEASVMNRKGFYMFPYLINRKGMREQLLKDYAKIVELNGTETYSANVKYYMSVANILAKQKKMDEAQIMAIHEKLSNIVAKNIETDKAKWEPIQTYIDAKLDDVVTITCDFVKKFYVPKMNEDIAFAKKVFHYMLKEKCTKEPEFIQSAKLIFDNEPTPGIARIIGQQAESAGDLEGALSWYEKAISLEKETAKKAEGYMDIAKIMSKKGRKSDARSYANKAVDADGSVAAEAYTFIGNLYFGSYKSCTGNDPVKARAIYLIAYDMFAKAGNGAGMSRCKEQFPSIEEIFTHKYQEGQSISVGCWVGGSTTIRKR